MSTGAKLSNGLGAATDQYGFTPVPGVTNAIQVAAEWGSSYIRLADGTILVTGQNNYGQLGLGDTLTRTTFTVLPGSVGSKALVLGDRNAFMQAANGYWYAAGNNWYGKLGLGDFVARNNFTLIPGLGLGNMLYANFFATFARDGGNNWMVAR